MVLNKDLFAAACPGNFSLLMKVNPFLISSILVTLRARFDQHRDYCDVSSLLSNFALFENITMRNNDSKCCTLRHAICPRLMFTLSVIQLLIPLPLF